jgi:hypothetical protein
MWISLNVATACRRREWERHKLEKRRFQLFPSEQSRRLFPSAITSPGIYSSRSPFAFLTARGFHRSAASSRISRPLFVARAARGLPRSLQSSSRRAGEPRRHRIEFKFARVFGRDASSTARKVKGRGSSARQERVQSRGLLESLCKVTRLS